jgi:four helix bundle protein
LNPDLTNSQFPILNSHPRGTAIADLDAMLEKVALSDKLEERLITCGAQIICLAGKLAKTFQGRHIARQILRSGTAGAANYAEARGAESRADFVHKMRLVQKELNETSVWLRLIVKSSLVSPDFIVAIVAENKELSRIITASIRTARSHAPVSSDEN